MKTSFRSSTEFLSTSLLISAAQGHIDVTKVLLDNGASYGEKDKVGFEIKALIRPIKSTWVYLYRKEEYQF